jgi:hypothetical protein
MASHSRRTSTRATPDPSAFCMPPLTDARRRGHPPGASRPTKSGDTMSMRPQPDAHATSLHSSSWTLIYSHHRRPARRPLGTTED